MDRATKTAAAAAYFHHGVFLVSPVSFSAHSGVRDDDSAEIMPTFSPESSDSRPYLDVGAIFGGDSRSSTIELLYDSTVCCGLCQRDYE